MAPGIEVNSGVRRPKIPQPGEGRKPCGLRENHLDKPHPDSEVEFWHVGTSPPAAPLLLKERFDKTLIPLLEKATVYT